MKNKFILAVVVLITVALFNTDNLTAQVTSESNSSWIGLSSYNGSTTVNAFRFSINLNHALPVNYSNWSLLVRVNSPITNGQKTFNDPSKISIRLNSISGDNYPTIAQVGASQTPIPLSFNDQYLIQRSNYPLQTDSTQAGWYKKFTFDFDIIIAGGSYLQSLFSYNPQYILSLNFSVLSESGQLLTQHTPKIQMQIAPSGTPPSGPEFGFEVNANATLNFTTPEDYTKQVENSPNSSWLKVTSKNTRYIVKVKTNSTDFTGDKGTIPVNVVSMKVDGPPNSASSAVPTVSLSNNEQVVFKGEATGTNPHLLDVRYFITKSEAEKLATKTPGQYTTTLTYTLSPP